MGPVAKRQSQGWQAGFADVWTLAVEDPLCSFSSCPSKRKLCSAQPLSPVLATASAGSYPLQREGVMLWVHLVEFIEKGNLFPEVNTSC